MKVKALHWVKTETGWHPTGETFEVESVEGLTGMVDIIDEAPAPAAAEAPVHDEETPVVRKRGRKAASE